MDSQQSDRIQLQWEDIASSSWFPGGVLESFWLTAFHVMRVVRSQLSAGPVTFDFGDAKALVFYGQVPYLRLGDLEVRSTDAPLFVGELYGFRNRIAHRGEIPSIHALLSDYVEALYLDVLYERLGLPSEGFAARIQADPKFDIASFIK